MFRRLGLGALLAALTAAAGSRARAEERDAPRAMAAPRRTLHVTIGLGSSRDRAPTEEAAKQMPAVFSSVGVGQGLVGVELAGFGSVGRGTDVSRLGFDLVLVLRPLGLVAPPPDRFAGRLLRGFALTAGPSGELLERSRENAFRFGIALGAHAEVPLTPPDLGRELRLRLGGRRMLAKDVPLGEHTVGDSAFEAYAAAVVAF